MSSNSNQPSRDKPISIERFLVKGRGIDTTSSREQGPPKRKPTAVGKTGIEHTKETPPDVSTPVDTEINPPPKLRDVKTASIRNDTKEGNKKEEASQEKVAIEVNDKQAYSRRFVLNIDLEASEDPKGILKQTARLVNRMLKVMQSYLQFRGFLAKSH